MIQFLLYIYDRLPKLSWQLVEVKRPIVRWGVYTHTHTNIRRHTQTHTHTDTHTQSRREATGLVELPHP